MAWIVFTIALRLAVAAICGGIIASYLPETIRAVRMGYPTIVAGLLIHFPAHMIGGFAIVWSAWRLARGKDHDSRRGEWLRQRHPYGHGGQRMEQLLSEAGQTIAILESDRLEVAGITEWSPPQEGLFVSIAA